MAFFCIECLHKCNGALFNIDQIRFCNNRLGWRFNEGINIRPIKLKLNFLQILMTNIYVLWDFEISQPRCTF